VRTTRHLLTVATALAGLAFMPAIAEAKPSATRDVLVVSNNWEGTADLVNPRKFKRIARLNVIPDAAERVAEITADPAKIINALAGGTNGILAFDAPVNCSGSTPTCCPNGTPVSPCGPINIDFNQVAGDLPRLEVRPAQGASRVDATVRARVKTAMDIPVKVPLVGDCGLKIDTTVGTVKEVALDGGARRTYVSVDGGMSDNIRTALYDADYSCTLASRHSDAPPMLTRVVGKHCEAGDILVKDEFLASDVRAGDLVAVPGTGAYCRSMASNYNHALRPPVIAVRDGVATVLLRRETEADLLATENVSGLDIKVETVDGVVTLTGAVANKAQKDKAVAVAKQIKGVTRVDASGLTLDPK
jgi:hypothetical protein